MGRTKFKISKQIIADAINLPNSAKILDDVIVTVEGIDIPDFEMSKPIITKVDIGYGHMYNWKWEEDK